MLIRTVTDLVLAFPVIVIVKRFIGVSFRLSFCRCHSTFLDHRFGDDWYFVRVPDRIHATVSLVNRHAIVNLILSTESLVSLLLLFQMLEEGALIVHWQSRFVILSDVITRILMRRRLKFTAKRGCAEYKRWYGRSRLLC